jgi:hypothetical protein
VAATTADARLVSRPPQMRGSLPLPTITLRPDDVPSAFVVFDVPAGARLLELVRRQVRHGLDRTVARRRLIDRSCLTVASVITTHQLSKRYGQQYALKDLDLEVRPGEVLGYLGPNGGRHGPFVSARSRPSASHAASTLANAAPASATDR